MTNPVTSHHCQTPTREHPARVTTPPPTAATKETAMTELDDLQHRSQERAA